MSTAHNVLPRQAAPIDRTSAGAAAFSSEASVDGHEDLAFLQMCGIFGRGSTYVNDSMQLHF
jgi:hypothetical protein